MDPNQNDPKNSDNSQNEPQPINNWQQNNENQTPAYNNTDYWNTGNSNTETTQSEPEQTNKQDVAPTPEPVENNTNENAWSTQNTPTNENAWAPETESEKVPSNPWTNTETVSTEPLASENDNTNPWTNSTTSNENVAPTPEPTSSVNETSNPVSKPPSSSSNALMVVMIALVVLLLGSTGLFAFQNYQLRQQMTGVSPTPYASATPIPTADPIIDWKTYTNTNLKASFKYPSTWTYKENPTKSSVDFNTGVASIEKVGEKASDYVLNFQIEDTKNFEAWSADKTTSKLESITVNGMVFERYIAADSYNSLNFIYKSTENKIFRFYLWPYTSAETSTTLDDTIKLILSTLKFDVLPSNSPISTETCSTGFEKFTNANFSFCYPTGMKPAAISTDTSIVLENTTETLRVVQNFQGGWGGSECLAINAVEVAGYKSKRLSWKTEKIGGTGCESTFTSFATMVNEGIFKSPFPYMIEYTKKTGTFADDKNFIAIETSFTPGK